MNPRPMIAVYLGIVIASALGGHCARGAEVENARLFDGLLDRRLYTPAGELCRQTLGDPNLAAAERRFWLARKVKLDTALALDAGGNATAREPLWKAALDSITTLARESETPATTLAASLELQRVRLAREEQLVREAQCTTGDDHRFDAVLKGAKDNRESIETILKKLEASLQQNALTIKEEQGSVLFHLLRGKCELSLALRLEALCMPVSGARTELLVRAQKQVESLFKVEGAAFFWVPRLEALRCMRALGNLDAARQLRAVLMEANPPPDVLVLLRNEQVRLELAADRFEVARELVREEGPEKFALPTEGQAEWDLIRLEVKLEEKKLAEKAQQEAEVEQLTAEAKKLVERISRRYGPGWGRSAELLVNRK